MKRLTTPLSLILTLLLFSATNAWSADFDRGVDAYEKGDYATALREWEPLVEQGIAVAQYSLGVMYAEGKGVPQDYKTAHKWYSLAAEQGHVDAQYNLGFMYANGQGVTQDDKTAVKWFSLAAEQGFADAQNNLGVMYALGNGVIQDNVYAHMWFNIAASLGDKDEAPKNRDEVEKYMTSVQIAKAQNVAIECVRKNYKGC